MREPAVPLAVVHQAPGVPRPSATLMLLHGYGVYEDHLLAFAQHLDPQDLAPCLRISAVRAPHRIGPGAYRWFDYTIDADGTVSINADEARIAFEALLDVLARERTETGLVFLLGHSQGGTMALSVLLARPDLLAGCAVLGARFPSEMVGGAAPDDRVRRVPVYVAHGRHDPRIPIAKAVATRERLARIGCPLGGRDYDVGHDVTPVMMADAGRWLGQRLAAATVATEEG
ncbi:hypothetical protein [uncultured Methylobacterium sp.]|uniref:alpha/beta hydrolase n=1 Tax=uncultured Methylobacterium sp. TaxID=157278 RepID=UPI00258B8403|nr:hypothetical protein [uncultured Methylobacterium sp.]